MKKFNYIRCMALIVLLLVIMGCDKCKTGTEAVPSKVDQNGLTPDITNIVPKEVIDEMKRIGMPINGGATPPKLKNGTYEARKFAWVSSNFDDKYTAGDTFSVYRVTFSGQDNDKLTIKVDYTAGVESGTGIGSYIVGEGCKFSVFVKINGTANGKPAEYINVISGTFVQDGIEGLYFSNFMLNNHGDTATWMKNNTGRVIRDLDGFSPKIGDTTGTWYSKLPACPCTYDEVKKLSTTTCPDGKWEACGSTETMNKYHYGASYEARWIPNSSTASGQQCTYDSAFRLITSGLAAGTPDYDAPRGCGGVTSFDAGHVTYDVYTWESSYSCIDYMAQWPPDNGNGCAPNPVNPIDHMKKMIGNMKCPQVIALLKEAKAGYAAKYIDDVLYKYITGTSVSVSNTDLVYKLEDWKAKLGCPSQDICLVIDTAIANLK